MNVTMLLMSSALIAGGDPGCAGCSPTPAVSYAAPAGCGCDPCGGSSGGLFSKLKSRFGGKPLLFGCGGFKQDDCDPCGSGPRQGLLSRLKDKLGCHKDPCPCSAPCDPCGGVGAPVTGCALPSVPGVPASTSMYGQPQAMPQTMYGQPSTAMPSRSPGSPGQNAECPGSDAQAGRGRPLQTEGQHPLPDDPVGRHPLGRRPPHLANFCPPAGSSPSAATTRSKFPFGCG